MEQPKIKTYQIECKNYGKTQIENSYNEIETKRRSDFDLISQIYKSTEAVENQRNIQNEESHEKRLKLLTDFEDNLPKEMAEINEKMKSLMEIEQADLLQEKFELFKLDCEKIMQQKKDLIVEFLKELDYRDQTYVDSMRNFHRDIERMIKLMSEQFIKLRDMMLNHLDQIENKFLEDRKDIIDEQYLSHIHKLIDTLDEIGTKKEKELTTLQDTLEENAEKAAKNTENDFINKVILMENHLNHIKEKVEEYLYEIKILYEKLEYRIKIRDEKIKEAEEKKDQFNSWDIKLRDKIGFLWEVYRKNDLQKRIKNSQLKTELLKMTESYDSLKEKFKHFEKHDELRFKEIYDMKSKSIKELALKVILADRTIKTQQLGMENIPNDNPEGFTLDELQKDQEFDENETAAAKEKDTKQMKNKFMQNIMDKISIPRVKQVFAYIIQEAEFLIERELIIRTENMTLDEKLVEYVESICRALNIKSEQELNQLLDLFYKHNLNNQQDDPNAENQNIDDSQSEHNHEIKEGENTENGDIIIDPDEVLDILKEFYNEKKKRAKEKSK